jgi:hypothetical protein
MPTMKFTTLIPTHFNNGKKIPARQLRMILDDLW